MAYRRARGRAAPLSPKSTEHRNERRCTHGPAPAQHALSSENGRDFPSLTSAAVHRATASHSRATRHPQTQRGHRLVPAIPPPRATVGPQAMRARIAATRQRAVCPFFHIRSGSQRPHTGLVHHTLAAGISKPRRCSTQRYARLADSGPLAPSPVPCGCAAAAD